MRKNSTQLIIIGAGPGGYTAAFLAADMGINVTLIDMEKHIGGVCLSRGCIPSKILLHVAKILANSREAKELGITFAPPEINIDKIHDWKNSIILKLANGLQQLCKQRKINLIQGKATFLNSNTIKVETLDGLAKKMSFDHAIIATGSHPKTLPFAPKSPFVLDSTSALNIENIPKKLLIIGGGYIGLELGTVYHELGSKVSVVEMTSGLLPGADNDLINILKRRLTNLFESIILNTQVTDIKETKNGVSIVFRKKNGEPNTAEYDKVLIAVGRNPNSKNLGLENTKVKINKQGFIQVNKQCQTTDQKIYAIGDIIGGPMLAHKASHDGRVAVGAIAECEAVIESKAIPTVIFTDPELAWCGLTETEAIQQNRPIKVVKFPWRASGRAMTLNRTDGLTKLIIDPQTERILGMAVIGVDAGGLIAEGALALQMGSTATDVKLTIHPHPTLSETIMEAAESFFGQCIHIHHPRKT